MFTKTNWRSKTAEAMYRIAKETWAAGDKVAADSMRLRALQMETVFNDVR